MMTSLPSGYKRLLLLPILFSFPVILSVAQCFTDNNVFGEKERIRYTVSYNWGPVWVDAGIVTFETGIEIFMGKQAWHFKASGRSFPSYDLLFKVRDYFDSYTDPVNFQPRYFKRQTYEGGYSLLNTLYYDYNAGKVYANTKTNNNPQRQDTLPVRPCSFDMLSAIYYTRTLDFRNAFPGWKKEIKILIDDAYYDIYVRFIGTELVQSNDGKTYRCYKIAAKMVQGTIFQGDEDVLVWVTADDNRVPVYIEAKIIVGTIKAYLKDTKGLKNPVSSLVKTEN